MTYCLAVGVQLRKESWGLIFYSRVQNRLSFIKSGDWLFPSHFDGTWTFAQLAGDIARRTGLPPHMIERNLQKSMAKLIENGMIIHELSGLAAVSPGESDLGNHS